MAPTMMQLVKLLPAVALLLSGVQGEILDSFPLCNRSGYTSATADYIETVYQASGSSVSACYDACLHNSACKSFAYDAGYTECIFYNVIVEDTQLDEDSSSSFEHYDLCCSIPIA
ncbi:hypothetical protein NA57DRAFT_75281 [Rhizodiscina lignyota]|uniref:Apple domain-containing protein n=1 Tax=Rhizodiscina lignyota TaxID=1504668 RepID=A0A9P4M6J3_9PEZI|nr:hypothetical protein NA57DRAFT_75281 [Rhizodiscina lignyota]